MVVSFLTIIWQIKLADSTILLRKGWEEGFEYAFLFFLHRSIWTKENYEIDFLKVDKTHQHLWPLCQHPRASQLVVLCCSSSVPRLMDAFALSVKSNPNIRELQAKDWTWPGTPWGCLLDADFTAIEWALNLITWSSFLAECQAIKLALRNARLCQSLINRRSSCFVSSYWAFDIPRSLVQSSE